MRDQIKQNSICFHGRFRYSIVMKTSILFLALLSSITALAQAQGPDYSKVEIKATHVAGNVYMLEGLGGNIGVSVGPDGVLMVDDQYITAPRRSMPRWKNWTKGPSSSC